MTHAEILFSKKRMQPSILIRNEDYLHHRLSPSTAIPIDAHKPMDATCVFYILLSFQHSTYTGTIFFEYHFQ